MTKITSEIRNSKFETRLSRIFLLEFFYFSVYQKRHERDKCENQDEDKFFQIPFIIFLYEQSQNHVTDECNAVEKPYRKHNHGVVITVFQRHGYAKK